MLINRTNLLIFVLVAGVFVSILAAGYADISKGKNQRTRLVVLDQGDTVVNVAGRHCYAGSGNAGIHFVDGRSVSVTLVSGIAYCIRAK